MQELLDNFFTLSDGSKLPRIGFGTYTEDFSDNTEAIETAIECGKMSRTGCEKQRAEERGFHHRDQALDR